jgi:DNA-binding response OmpR family regulator
MTKPILLVDDDLLLRRRLAFNLEWAGYRASTAANAEDALALARRDLVQPCHWPESNVRGSMVLVMTLMPIAY